MNVNDVEWKPKPSDPVFLRKVRIAVKSAASAGDIARLRAMLLNEGKGIIPHEVRGMVWILLLGVNPEEVYAESADAFSQAALQSVSDENSREQILKDVVRTRPALTLFKQEHVRNALTRLLSLFCLREKVSYIQGFNELLAPFLLLDDVGGNPRLVFALYSAFVHNFAPWMLDPNESKVFEVLKRAFRYLGRLLLYFDPHLFWMLDRQYMTPDIYATSWLVTVFARNFTIETTYALWDLLLLELPEVLMNMSAASIDEVHRQWRNGNELRIQQTPPSFQRLMASRLLRPLDKPNQSLQGAIKSMQEAVTLQTTVEDIMPGGGMHFFTWDCRPLELVNNGRIAQSAHLPLDALRNAEDMIKKSREGEVEKELRNAIDLCKALSGRSHLCLVGSGDAASDALDVQPLALRLTKEGIPCVSTLRGGFKGVLASVENGNPDNVELVDLNLDNLKKIEQQKTGHLKKKSPGVHRKSGTHQVSSLTEKSDADVRRILNSMLTPQSSESTPALVLPSVDDMLRNQSTSLYSSQVAENEPTVPSGSAAAQPDTSSGNMEPTSLGLLSERLGSLLWSSSEPKTNGITHAQERPVEKTGRNPFETEEELVGAVYKKVPAPVTNPFDTQGSSTNPSRKEPVPPSNPFMTQDDSASSTSRRERPVPIMQSNSASKTKEFASTSNLFETPGNAANSSHVEGPIPITQSKSAAKSFWGKAASAGWLDEKTLIYPPEGIQKGFTLNIENVEAMAGIRLFPCWSDSGSSKKDSIVLYFGISDYYLSLYVPYRSSAHMLELKMLRRLCDLRRLSFRKKDPNLMTLEFAQRGKTETEPISIKVLDGRKEIVSMISSLKN